MKLILRTEQNMLDKLKMENIKEMVNLHNPMINIIRESLRKEKSMEMEFLSLHSINTQENFYMIKNKVKV